MHFFSFSTRFANLGNVSVKLKTAFTRGLPRLWTPMQPRFSSWHVVKTQEMFVEPTYPWNGKLRMFLWVPCFHPCVPNGLSSSVFRNWNACLLTQLSHLEERWPPEPFPELQTQESSTVQPCSHSPQYTHTQSASPVDVMYLPTGSRLPLPLHSHGPVSYPCLSPRLVLSLTSQLSSASSFPQHFSL